MSLANSPKNLNYLGEGSQIVLDITVTFIQDSVRLEQCCIGEVQFNLEKEGTKDRTVNHLLMAVLYPI